MRFADMYNFVHSTSASRRVYDHLMLRGTSCWLSRLAISAMTVCAACGFSVSGAGEGSDATPPVTIGFASATSLQDEASGMVSVPVTLSGSAGDAVTVHYAVTGGSATLGTDYTISEGTLSFGAGETQQMIELTILADDMEEPNETIELGLDSPTNGVLGAKAHTITINANVLPRVRFALASSQHDETPGETFDVVLDVAGTLPITVDYAVTGTATGGGVDYTLANGVISFPPGVTSQQIVLGEIDDALNEDPETVAVSLANPTNVILGATLTQTHTILDNDPMPSVSFALASSSVTEMAATVQLTVTLSAASGRTVTVPFSAALGSSASAPADYSFQGTMITFPSLTTTQVINVDIVNDTIDEADEIVATELGAPTNAMLGGTTTSNLTILDNDQACFGAGASTVCFDRGPTTGLVLPATIDTVNSALCSPTQAIGWTGQGQPAACFVLGTAITMNATTTVTGTRPLVLVGGTAISISNVLDVASHQGGTAGPAARATCTNAFGRTPVQDNAGGGGGAGGSFLSAGGDGGRGNNNNNTEGLAPAQDAAPPTVLRAGCAGQKGANGDQNSGAAGRGGGVVYLVAGSTISISGTINASGSAGIGGGHHSGGSGAGSGGMVKLYAPTINATGGRLFANGGGGASSGDGGNGTSGSDPTTATAAALGGTGGAANGGSGFAAAMAAQSGTDGSGNKGGGGGGGGGGYIQANLALTGATVSAGLIQAP